MMIHKIAMYNNVEMSSNIPLSLLFVTDYRRTVLKFSPVTVLLVTLVVTMLSKTRRPSAKRL
jgi:hypothetical protein